MAIEPEPIRPLRPVTGLDPDGRDTLFIPMPIAGLRADAMTGFDLYLRGQGRDRFVLYRRGETIFTEEHRRKLEDSRVRYVYVQGKDRDAYRQYLETHLEAIIQDARVSPDEKSVMIYDCSSSLVQEALRRPWAGEHHRRARRLVHHTVQHLLRGGEAMAGLLRLLTGDYRLYTHSVNVCVLGLGLGERAGLSAPELEELGAGLLLHDLGLSEVPPALLSKQLRAEPLTPEEEGVYRLHTRQGCDHLRRGKSCGAAALAVVAQHHERCCGGGHPEGARGAQIHYYAKIAGLVDAFDILTTRGTPLSSFAALQHLQREQRRDFHPELLRCFILMLGRHADAASDAEPPAAAA